jgi:hypothetical protein
VLISSSARAQSALSVTLTASTDRPTAGEPITWTAHVTGARGQVVFRFLLYDPDHLTLTDWVDLQVYNPNNTVTWTPVSRHVGRQIALQVWVTDFGVTEPRTLPYDAWAGTGLFVVRAPRTLTITPGPMREIAVGTLVVWEALVDLDGADVEYQFWRLHASTWEIVQPYSRTISFSWRVSLADVGFGALQVWARRVGDSVPFTQWAGRVYDVRPLPAVHEPLILLADPVPGRAREPMTFAAIANVGSAPLEYQFWRRDPTGWIVAQKYSPTPTYTWNPDVADAGDHAVQAWVRKVGSAMPYDGWASTNIFNVSCPPGRVGLQFGNAVERSVGSAVLDTEMPAPVTAISCSAEPVEYQFAWLLLGLPVVLRDYDPSPTLDWSSVSPLLPYYLVVKTRPGDPALGSALYGMRYRSGPISLGTIELTGIVAPPGSSVDVPVRIDNVGAVAFPANFSATLYAVFDHQKAQVAQMLVGGLPPGGGAAEVLRVRLPEVPTLWQLDFDPTSQLSKAVWIRITR